MGLNKRTIADACDTIRDNNIRKSCAIERTIADACDTSVCRNNTCFTSDNKCFCCRFYNTIPITVISSIIRLHNYTRKSRAIIERLRADACDTVGDIYARKSRANTERTNADACDTVGDSYARKSPAIIERIRADACDTVGDNNIPVYKLSVYIEIFCIIKRVR